MSFTGEIINCYDSHCHFQGAGQASLTLNLRKLRCFEDLQAIELKPEYFFGDWLIGFGWDQSYFENQLLPSRLDLDQLYPDFPVAFSRADGHAILLNSVALNRIGKVPENLISQVEFVDGHQTGIFFEHAKEWVEKAIPQPSAKIQKAFLIEACRLFNQAGVTHIRDMTTTELQWNMEIELFNEGLLTLCVEHLFYCENSKQIANTVKVAKNCSKLQNSQMKVEGIKIFIDGSLGSKTAFLSKPYLGTNSCGLLLWNFAEIKEAIQSAWSADLGIAIHAIGDAASLLALKAACEIKATYDLNGWIAIEHAELLSDEAIELSKKLNVRFHIQPCHYLSDSQWLKSHIDVTLMKSLFRWRALEKVGKPIFFGTDCPVESADPMQNYLALEKAQLEGIQAPEGSFASFHQCPNFLPTKKSVFENSRLVQISNLPT